jgi:hypothetical protein
MFVPFIFLLNAKALSSVISKDLEFAKKTNESWERIKEGKCTEMDFDDFLNEMKKW